MIILATSYYFKLNKGVCAAHPFLKTHGLCIPLHCRRSKGLHTVMKSTLLQAALANIIDFFFFYHMLSLIFPWWYCLLIFFGFQKHYTTFYYLVLYFLDILKSLLSCFPTAFLSISAGISPRSVPHSQFFPLLTNGYRPLAKWRPWESEKPMFWIPALLMIVSIFSEQTLDSVSSVLSLSDETDYTLSKIWSVE